MPSDVTEMKAVDTSVCGCRQAGDRMTIAVGIATRGRASTLAGTIAQLALQDRKPDKVVVAYVDDADVALAPEIFPDVLFLRTELGLTRQRNAILEQTLDCDFIVFIDDDFYLDRCYLAVAANILRGRSDIVVGTGKLLADGIHGPGLTHDQATHLLVGTTTIARTKQRVTNVYNAYGCNMILRIAPIVEHRLRFDEQLPLYGWWEDVDFSRQMRRYGSVVMLEGALGVHLGAKSGRTAGVRLGYSQVANPIYMARKGTLSWSRAVVSVGRRFLRNLMMSLAPEPEIDRRGRLRGNLLGLRELVSGVLSPQRALVH